MKVLLASPRGFCAGVKRAIETVEHALSVYGRPVYVRHEIVHNTHVVEDLRQKGAVFIEDLHEVPAGSVLVFSAHGVSQTVRKQALSGHYRLFDATCPLVRKVHKEVTKQRQNGCDVVCIGHQGHPEVEGTLGQSDVGMHLISDVDQVDSLTIAPTQKVAYVSQTTLSVDDTKKIIAALRSRYPQIVAPKKADICYATTNRQQAVKTLAKQATLIIVVGSANSSNSNRLSELARTQGAVAYRVDDASQIDPKWLEGHTCIGVTAGASAPEQLVEEVVDFLRTHGATHVEEMYGISETVTFALPQCINCPTEYTPEE